VKNKRGGIIPPLLDCSQCRLNVGINDNLSGEIKMQNAILAMCKALIQILEVFHMIKDQETLDLLKALNVYVNKNEFYKFNISSNYYLNTAKNMGKIEAIRQYKKDSGVGLIAAKNYIEDLLKVNNYIEDLLKVNSVK
jgi:ribosomal protein L7/L12